MKKTIIALALTLGCLTLNPVLANSIADPRLTKLLTSICNLQANSVNPSPEQFSGDSAKLATDLNLASGSFESFRLIKSSSIPQSNLDLLDTVMMLGKQEIPNEIRADDKLQFEFTLGKTPSLKTLPNLEKFKRDLKPKPNCSVFYAIPLIVLQKYPSLFTYEELTSKTHLRNFPNDHIDTLELYGLRSEWIDFIETHEKATRQEILELEQKINNGSGLLHH